MSDSRKEFKVLDIEGIAMFAQVHKPVTNRFQPNEPPKYKIDLIVEKGEEKVLKAEGLSPAKKEIVDLENDTKTKVPKEYPGFEGKKVFTFYRKSAKKDGSPNTPLAVVDSQVLPIPNTTLIGNGSRVIVSINPWSMTTNEGLIHGANLLAVQVLDLVPYTATAQTLTFKKQKGFIASNDSVKEVSGDVDDENINF